MTMNNPHFGIFVIFLVAAACNNLNTIDFTANDNAAIQNESNVDAQASEADDLATVTVSADAATLNGRVETGGRIITSSDTRLKCAVITLDPSSDNTLLKPHGIITVDFGNGCAGPAGKIRSGKIVIEYIGRRFLPGSKIIITFVQYVVNGKMLEGTRTLTNTSTSETAAVAFTILEDGMKITYPDGTTATRTSTFIRTWNRTSNAIDDSFTITGSAVGTTRKGKEYTMSIKSPLVFKRSCAINNNVFLPVSGIKELVTDNRRMVVNFGDGNCDDVIELTINGKTKTIDISAD